MVYNLMWSSDSVIIVRVFFWKSEWICEEKNYCAVHCLFSHALNYVAVTLLFCNCAERIHLHEIYFTWENRRDACGQLYPAARSQYVTSVGHLSVLFVQIKERAKTRTDMSTQRHIQMHIYIYIYIYYRARRPIQGCANNSGTTWHVSRRPLMASLL